MALADETFWLVAPPNAEVPSFGRPSWTKEYEAWLAAQPWISYGTELPIIRRFWREHFHKRPPIEPVMVLPNLLTIQQAVTAGVGSASYRTICAGREWRVGHCSFSLEERMRCESPAARLSSPRSGQTRVGPGQSSVTGQQRVKDSARRQPTRQRNADGSTAGSLREHYASAGGMG